MCSALISAKNIRIYGGFDAEKQLTVQMDNVSNVFCLYNNFQAEVK